MMPMIDSIEALRASEKFRNWKQQVGPLRPQNPALSAAEKHFTPDELAGLWAVSVDTIRNIFRSEPGVLKVGKTGGRFKRGYQTLRIPESIAEKVHTRLSA
jgi:hypothetical protein